MYWQEYRTELHIAQSYGVSEATLCRTIRMVEADRKSAQIIATAFSHGSKHDFQLFIDDACEFSEQLCIQADAGYEGLMGHQENSQTPFKKSKYHALTKREKQSNRRKRFAMRFNLIAAI